MKLRNFEKSGVLGISVVWYGWSVGSSGVPVKGFRGEGIVLCQILECLQ